MKSIIKFFVVVALMLSVANGQPVARIDFVFETGGDDLRGGDDNLNL